MKARSSIPPKAGLTLGISNFKLLDFSLSEIAYLIKIRHCIYELEHLGKEIGTFNLI
jgi:hypothetical protein